MGSTGARGVSNLANYIAVYGDFFYKFASPVFVLLCVLCFQSQPFRFFIRQ